MSETEPRILSESSFVRHIELSDVFEVWYETVRMERTIVAVFADGRVGFYRVSCDEGSTPTCTYLALSFEEVEALIQARASFLTQRQAFEESSAGVSVSDRDERPF